MIPADTILLRICNAYTVDLADLIGPRRLARLTAARQAAAWCLMAAGYGCQEAGELLRRDHTTILYSRDRACGRADGDAAEQARLCAILDQPPDAYARLRALARREATGVCDTPDTPEPARAVAYPVTAKIRLSLAFWGVAAPASA